MKKEEEFEVEKILDEKIDKGIKSFLLKWVIKKKKKLFSFIPLF